jgi:Xaa-Pro aminopeptidase
VQRATGIGKVLPVERFESELRASLEKHLGVCALTEDKEAAARLEKLAPLRQIQNAQRAIAHRRMKKEPEEIAAIQRSIDATVAAHLAGWKRAAPGVAEYQVAVAMIAVYLDKGCERSAYAPIVGSGPNSTILHYSRNSRVMDKGETLVVDVGAECAGYAADVTRTIPVGGRFSPRQREIYDVVLGAQKAVIAAIRPGVLIGSRGGKDTLYRVAYDYINTHGKDLHGEPLGQYFIHGISHNVGLDVHDAEDLSLPLAAGMVITVEPGVYIPEENIGVRIEDTVLVTEDGCKVMSAALPKEAAEIEKILKK